jgi:hypothetical protein
MPDSPNDQDSRSAGEQRASHSNHQNRRRRRHKKDKPRSKLAIAAFVALIVVVAAAIFFAVQPSAPKSKPRVATTPQQTSESQKYIALRSRTILIMNASLTDWGYTKVTVNGRFEANCPEIPKGTQFEIFYKDLRGAGGAFDPNAEKVETVKLEPEGQKAIVWTRPIE